LRLAEELNQAIGDQGSVYFGPAPAKRSAPSQEKETQPPEKPDEPPKADALLNKLLGVKRPMAPDPEDFQN
jgi:hypothetical protein